MEPIDMVLHCPECHAQHIDGPELESIPWVEVGAPLSPRNVHAAWANPPHRSHLCHQCGTIWRPADVCTNGVAAIGTRGRGDTWPA